ncbi:MAG: polyphenol oxidase family protein [Candidatus Geothermincolia bacterium]
MLELVSLDGLEVLTAPALERECGVRVVYTGKHGAAGDAARDNLNISFDVGNDPRAVDENRRAVCQALGVGLDRWVLCRQVHGTAVAEVGALEAGRGAADYWSAIPRTDGLVTRCEELVLGVLTADCLPVVLVDPIAPAVAVVHAGWRGVLSGIAVEGARKLVDRSRGSFRDMLVFIGPHIGACCFEVGDEVAGLFDQAVRQPSVVDEGARRTVDLGVALVEPLLALGVKAENCFDAGVCTMCSDDYFSFREDPHCGRQAALAWILEEGRGG